MPALKQYSQKTMEETEADDKGSNSDVKDLNSVFITTPLVAVPEKIVLCIDITEDASSKSYSCNSANGNPFYQLKKCLSGFVHNKNSFNNDHEFAIMSLEPGGIKWIQDFSNDPKEVIKAINDLEIICQSEPIDADVMPIFKEVKEHIGKLPEVKISAVQFPNYIVRLILIYNSSYNIPKIDSSNELFVSLINSDYFKFDILYLHDAPSEENKCQEIFDNLLAISTSGSYIFESSRKIVKLYNNMARLLPHPLQRCENPHFNDY